MQGSRKSIPPFSLPPDPPWTVDEAQTVLGEVAHQLVALVETLDAIHSGLPEPPDIEDRQEGRKPYDRATDVLATIECVKEDDLTPAIEALQRSATVTDAELEQEYQVWLRSVV
ncbi:MAG TPA: hypothetical protein VJA16_18025 [Thermoanaerobaculia bacterium]